MIAYRTRLFSILHCICAYFVSKSFHNVLHVCRITPKALIIQPCTKSEDWNFVVYPCSRFPFLQPIVVSNIFCFSHKACLCWLLDDEETFEQHFQISLCSFVFSLLKPISMSRERHTKSQGNDPLFSWTNSSRWQQAYITVAIKLYSLFGRICVTDSLPGSLETNRNNWKDFILRVRNQVFML